MAVIYSLGHRLFRWVSFSFSRDFPRQNLTATDWKFHIVMVVEHALYDIASFKFIETCVVAQDVIHLDKCTMCT